MTGRTDWNAWHLPYADRGSPLSRRLTVVQALIAGRLDVTPGDVTVLSLCAGDGRDLIGVLRGRSDAGRVTATLVEWDQRLAAAAVQAAVDAGLTGVTVRCADAGLTDCAVDAVPADLLLLCGIFGNISDDDVRHVVSAAPSLCAPGALVVWTRHTRDPDLTSQIRRWFAEVGFEERAFVAPDDFSFSVGAHQLSGPTRQLRPGQRLFTFLR